MKTILLIIAAACSVAGLRAQTLEPLLDTTKRWTDLSFCTAKDIYGGHTSTYRLSGMEEINGQDYFKLWVSEKDPQFQNWTLKGYMRGTTDGKVYLIDNYSQQEILLFDFSLNTGDSLVVDQNGTFIIDSVKFLPFAGKVRKHIYFHISQLPFLTVYWIEGVGSSIGFINSKYVGSVGGGWAFLCFEQNGELLYHNQINIDGCGPIEDCYYSALPLSGGDNITAAGNSWSDIEVTLENGIAHYRTISYKLGAATTFYDKIYYKLYQSSDSLGQYWTQTGYIGNYCLNFISLLNNYGQNEIILYHFPGNYIDTIDYGGNGIVITSHESKFFAGRDRVYWYGHTYPSNRLDTIIEGIGSITSGFLGVLNAGLENKNIHMLCFNQNEALLYHYPLQIPNYGPVEGCYVNYTNVEKMQEKEFNLYPNPAENEISILCESLPARLQLYDMQGSLCLTKHLIANRTVINLKGFEKGIYLVRIESKGKVVNLKLMK